MALTTALGLSSIFGHRYAADLSRDAERRRLYDHASPRRTVGHLVGLDRLSRAKLRFSLACTNLKAGDDVYFDNTCDEIRPTRVLASGAPTRLFPPLEADLIGVAVDLLIFEALSQLRWTRLPPITGGWPRR